MAAAAPTATTAAPTQAKLLLSYLSQTDHQKLHGMMIALTVPAGKKLMEQGQAGNSFFIVLDGTAEVLIDGLCVRKLGKGSCCGELSMITGKPRTATVTALEDCHVLSASAKVFHMFFGERVAKKRAEWAPYLRTLPLFGNYLDAYGCELLADVIEPCEFEPGAVICKRGTPWDGRFYVVRDGSVVDDAKKKTQVKQLHGPGEHFGEIELLQHRETLLTRKAGPGGALFCAALPASEFHHLPTDALVSMGREAMAHDVHDSQVVGKKTAVFVDANAKDGGGGGGKKGAGGGGRKRQAGVAAESGKSVLATNGLEGLLAEKQRTKAGAKLATATAAAVAVAAMPDKAAPPPKSAADEERSRMALEAAVKAQPALFGRLDEAQLAALSRALLLETVKEGKHVIEQGDTVADKCYIVESGELDAIVSIGPVLPHAPGFGAAPHGKHGGKKGKKGAAAAAAAGAVAPAAAAAAAATPAIDAMAAELEAPKEEVVRSYKAGELFGELALLYHCPRTATVRATTDSKLWSLERAVFQNVVLEVNARRAIECEKFLAQVPLLGTLEAGARSRLVDALEEVRYEKGDSIIDEGENGTHFYLVMQGNVSVTKQGRGEIAKRGVGDYLGERSLQRALPTSASVSAATACRVMRMDKATFERLLGPVLSQEAAQPLLRRYESSTADEILNPLAALSAADGAAAAMKPPPHEFERGGGTVRLSDFTMAEETLGAGGFGSVRCCCHKATGKVFAMKHMHKRDVLRAARRVVQESQALSSVAPHRFIANKFASLQTTAHLVLVLEFCSNGDLFDLLERHGAIDEADAKIFASQLLLAIEHVHAHGVVHRDIKLENILVADDGTLKLTDFGFATHVDTMSHANGMSGRCWTLCGTPLYMSPEMALQKGHGKPTDFWSLGVVLFELMAGDPPFNGDDELSIYTRIIDSKVVYPKLMSEDAVALLSSLLQKDISCRAGCLAEGTKDIKVHPFCAGIDWTKPAVRRAICTAPRPTTTGAADGAAGVPDAEECLEWPSAETILTDVHPCPLEQQHLFDGF